MRITLVICNFMAAINVIVRERRGGYPKESGQKPVYVSVTEVLTPVQLKQRQDEETRRQQEWDATHPVEVAERNYRLASDVLHRANADVVSNW